MKHFIFIVLFLLPLYLNAQFREGYIITNQNDTIKGFLNFEGTVINSTQCVFKIDGNDSPLTYKPGDIKAFRFINGKYFISSTIQIDNNPRMVFLEWLIKGKASILSYSPSSLEPRYFIIHGNDSLCELKNSSVIRNIDGVTYDIEKKEYIGMLKTKLIDCPQLFNTITTMPFSGNSLIKVSKKYHEIVCSEEACIIFEDKSRKLVYSFGISAGYVNSVFKINSNPLEFMNTVNTANSGLYLSISNLPFLSPKLSLQTGMYYLKALYTFEYSKPIPIDDDKVVNVHTLKVPLMLKYNFSTSRLSPYCEIGIVSNMRPSYQFYNKYLVSYITRHYDYYYQDIRFIQLGFMGGCGITYQTPSKIGLNLGLDYELSPRFFGTYPADKTMITNLMINCSVFYTFDRNAK